MKRILVTFAWWFVWRKSLVPSGRMGIRRAWAESEGIIKMNGTRCVPDLVMMIISLCYPEYSWRLFYWRKWTWLEMLEELTWNEPAR